MRNQIYLIGNAHIDPVWLWQWQDGFAEIKATFRAALDRIDEFPEFVFTSACACYYSWIEDNAPEMFDEIKKRISEGRFAVAGGFWIQPDCNIPSGESFCRHALYSQRYFKEKFGVMATVGYNVDSFGHNGMLPQICKKSGMDFYVFMRPDHKEKNLAANLFTWQSPDGSEVLTFKIPISYNDWLNDTDMTHYEGLHPVVVKILETRRISEEQALPMMCFYGVGNHGGGPTVAALKAIESFKSENPDIAAYASPQQYFNEVVLQKDDLLVVRDDLQHHASGCYSAISEIKMLNRKAENRLLTAEKLMTCAHSLLKHPYEHKRLENSWRKLMFNQFHDILAGCCIKEACEDAVEAFGESLNISAELSNAAFQKISWNVNTTGESNPVLSKENDWMLWENENKGVPVVIFNPHSFAIEAPIKINKELGGVTDKDGHALPMQKIRGSQTNLEDVYNTLFLAKLPPMGYTTCWLFKERVFAFDTAPVSAMETVLENELLRMELSADTGNITALINKTTGENLLLAPVRNVIIDESDSDTWAHAVFEFSNEIGEFASPSITVIENGPVRASIRVEQSFEDTLLRQDYTLLSGKAQIDVSVKMDVRLHHKQIKICFPLNHRYSHPVYSMPYGFIEKTADGLEEPSQQWVAAVCENGEKFALLNNGKYSFSMKNSTLRMLAVRTPAYADHFGKRDALMEYTDQGVREFNYSILPCSKGYGEITRAARVLNQPPEYLVETYHKGKLSDQEVGIDISNVSIIAEVFKRSEDNNGYVLRLFESAGMSATDVKISCVGRDFNCSFVPQEIKTIFIPDDARAAMEERMITEFEYQ